ncbi:MAG: hypothetical protein HUU35_18240, partial [Armatimonadetes bacterium]|nr:hypothetical protein [Armatimonadota bacterium]
PSPALNAALAAMLRAMVCPPLLGPLTASYAVTDGQVTRTWRQTLVGRAEALRLEVEPVANHLAGAAELQPREVREVTWPGGQVTSLADLTARFASRLRVGDVVYPTETTLDYREQLVKLADFLAREGEDGKFSGIAFIDHRGVRALLGAYEVTGERRYLETALRWGLAMVAEQRDDGGYRMGYGITSRGEECYVADGGEIALGMARLVPYAAAAERPRLMQSLAGYFAYRESFRVPSGGIGVGWCLSDYGQRPVTPLATPTRIYAPELNTYTIGCTLAAAYAYASLTGDPALERQAEADADWLMPRLKSLSGASGESFCWAHALTTDPARRRLYADYLRTHLIAPLLARKPLWWLNSGGRASLDLDLLVYYYTRVSRQPEVLAAIATAASGMFAADTPGSVHRFLGRPNLGHDPWLYLCFSGVGLADLVQPLVTLRGFERQTAGGVNSPGGGGPAG